MDDQGKLKVFHGSLKATPTTTATAVTTTSSATNAVLAAVVAVPATVMGGYYEEKRTQGSLVTFNNNANDDNGTHNHNHNHNHTHYTTNNRISHNSNSNTTPMIETTGELIVDSADSNRVMSTLEIDGVQSSQHNNNTEDTYMQEKTAELLSTYATWVAFGCWVPCLLLTIIMFYIISSHTVGYNGSDVAVQNYGFVVIHGMMTVVFFRKMKRTFRDNKNLSTSDMCCYPQFNQEDPAANRAEYNAQKEEDTIALRHPILTCYLRIISLTWLLVFVGCLIVVLVPTVQFMQDPVYYENSNNTTYIAQLVCMVTQLLVLMVLTCWFLPYYNKPNGRGMTKVVARYATEIQEWDVQYPTHVLANNPASWNGTRNTTTRRDRTTTCCC